MSKRTSHGLPGIYNSTPLSLSDGQGAALAVDSAGRLTLDPTSVAGGASTTTSAAPTQVASSATVVTLKSENANRKLLTIMNDSTQVLYVKYGSAATTSDYNVKLIAGAYFELPTDKIIYTGIVTGIWASANGNAYVTEA